MTSNGTAIVVGAAVKNRALVCSGQEIEDIKIVSTGGGLFAHRLPEQCLLKLGVNREIRLAVGDIHGWCYEGREIDH